MQQKIGRLVPRCGTTRNSSQSGTVTWDRLEIANSTAGTLRGAGQGFGYNIGRGIAAVGPAANRCSSDYASDYRRD